MTLQRAEHIQLMGRTPHSACRLFLGTSGTQVLQQPDLRLTGRSLEERTQSAFFPAVQPSHVLGQAPWAAGSPWSRAATAGPVTADTGRGRSESPSIIWMAFCCHFCGVHLALRVPNVVYLLRQVLAFMLGNTFLVVVLWPPRRCSARSWSSVC